MAVAYSEQPVQTVRTRLRTTCGWRPRLSRERSTYGLSSMDYREALRQSRVLELLDEFDPRVVGTLPLGLAVATSDIDIVCHAADLDAFAETLWKQYRDFRRFRMYQWTAKSRPLVARFDLGDWIFELFGDAHPVDQQPGWRHFDVERRLLQLDDGRLRAVLVRLRANGQKTEPAFAAALGLDGDPYEAMLRLALEPDSQLCARIKGLGAMLPIEGHTARD